MSNDKNNVVEMPKAIAKPVLNFGGNDYEISFGMQEMKQLSQAGLLLKQDIDLYGDTLAMFMLGTKKVYNLSQNKVTQLIDNALDTGEYKLIDIYALIRGYMGDRASELGFI